jgi:DNA-binding transcriptional ArsR family regulator
MFKYTLIEPACQEVTQPPLERVAELAGVFKVLSDPTRLRILSLLLERTHCNCEIAAALDISLSLVSHHMRILRLIGLVNGVRQPGDERWVYYSVKEEAVRSLESVLLAVLHPAKAGSSMCPPDANCCRVELE